jgi:hypothetical protein
MIVLVVLVAATLVFRLAGRLGVRALGTWKDAARWGLAAMLLLTARWSFRNLLLVTGPQLLFAKALARDFELPKNY